MGEAKGTIRKGARDPEKCPDCNGAGAWGCPGGYLEKCDRCNGTGRHIEETR